MLNQNNNKELEQNFLFKGRDMERKLLLSNSDGIGFNDELRELVAVSAYYKAKKRDFNPGCEMDDWLESEQEIKSRFRYWF